MIIKELSSIKMNQKQTISNFDYRFLALLNKLPVTSWSENEIICGFYLSTLPTIVVVFVMNKYLHTLDKNFEAAENFERGMISLGKNICGDCHHSELGLGCSKLIPEVTSNRFGQGTILPKSERGLSIGIFW